jgi:hypothetical protein
MTDPSPRWRTAVNPSLLFKSDFGLFEEFFYQGLGVVQNRPMTVAGGKGEPVHRISGHDIYALVLSMDIELKIYGVDTGVTDTGFLAEFLHGLLIPGGGWKAGRH